MKFSQKTIDVLKNFSAINTGLIFPIGKELSTMSGMRSILASVEIDEEIPQRFAIYDLNEFLGVLTMFESPEIELFDKYMLISSGKNKIKYFYSNESNIAAPQKTINELVKSWENNDKFKTPDMSFTITKSELDQLNKAAGIMKLINIGISKTGIRAFIPEVPSSNDFLLNVDVSSELDDELELKIENMKFFPGDYEVKCYKAGITHWVNKNTSHQYAITMEKK